MNKKGLLIFVVCKILHFLLNWGIIIFCVISCAISCATKVRYQSSGKIPIFISPQNVHHHQAKKIFELESYLYGTYPEHHIVNLDHEFLDAGFISVGNVKIHEYKTFVQYFYTLISFGLYSPMTIELYGFGKKSTRDD